MSSFALLASFVLQPLFTAWIHKANNLYYQHQHEAIKKNLLQEAEYVRIQTIGIAHNPSLAESIRDGNTLSLVSILQDEQQKRQLGISSAINLDGVVLTRTRSLSFRGDNTLQTTPHGRALAQDKNFASFEISPIHKDWLILTSGAKVMHEGSPVGYVTGGNVFDRAYLNQLRQKFDLGGTQLLAYTKESGIVAHTLPEEDTALVTTYFNSGSDWIREGRGADLVSLEGTFYILENIQLPGLEGINGGLLVLFPINPMMNFGARFASCTFTIFLILIFILHRLYKRHKRCPRYMTVSLLTGLITTAIISWAYYGLLSEYQALVIRPVPYPIYNSTLAFEPETELWDISVPHTVSLKLSSGGESINAVQVNLEFDPAVIQVLQINTTNSICPPQFFIKKEIDNTAGKIHIVCGTPSPGFTGSQGTIAELSIKPIKDTNVNLHFADGTKVLANDGLGTNVLRQAMDSQFSIVDYNNPAGLSRPLLNSPTNPNGARWYNTKKVTINWKPIPGQTYFFTFDQNRNGSAEEGITTNISNLTLPTEQDGTYYLHFLVRKGDKLEFRRDMDFHIDTTPPAITLFKASSLTPKTTDLVRIEFAATDRGSGLQNNAYIRIDEGVYLPVTSPFMTSFPKKGIHAVRLRVFDNAGNFTDQALPVNAQN